MNKIKNFLFFTSYQKVLSFLLDYPSSFHTEKEIVKATNFKKSAVNKALRELAENRIILQKKKGRMSFYSVDIDNPLIRSLKIVKDIVLLEPLIEKLKDKSQKIILFGSFSKGTNVKNSDIDLFILSDDLKNIRKIIESSSLTEKIQLIAKKPVDFLDFSESNSVLYQEIEKGFNLWEKNE